MFSLLSEEQEIERVLNENPSDDHQLSFVLLLKNYPSLMEKSQVPKVKAQKTVAIAELISKWQEMTGDNLTKDKLMKKINNMKDRVKKKSDIHKTGNKKINLLQWESEFLSLVNYEKNPVFAKIPGAVSSAVSKIGLPAIPSKASTSTALTSFVGQKSATILPPPDSNKRKKQSEDVIKSYETEETEVLSTAQLNRLVMIEQLQVLRLKRKKLESEVNENRQVIVIQESNSVCVSSQELRVVNLNNQ